LSKSRYEYNSDTGRMENTGTTHKQISIPGDERATVTRRIAAVVIDNLAVWIVIMPLVILVHPWFFPEDTARVMLPVVGATGGTTALVLYYWLFTGLSGQTPGKKLFKIRAVNKLGKKPGLIRALWRETIGRLILLISFVFSSILYLVSSLSAFWYDTTVFNSYPERGFRKPMDREFLNFLGFFDRICGTQVIKAGKGLLRRLDG